jgi:hypothetical protein
MNKNFIFCICATALTSGCACAKPLVLAQAGTAHYVIAVAGEAIPAEQTAAREMQEYVRKISGATIPILSEAQVAQNSSP